eukprot:7919055-Alexandrium_andersonii.AAC.1
MSASKQRGLVCKPIQPIISGPTVLLGELGPKLQLVCPAGRARAARGKPSGTAHQGGPSA